MRFSDWFALDDAHEHAPNQSGLFQVKIREGLLTYPHGKTAMYYYGYAEDLSHGALFFLEEILPSLDQDQQSLLIRWMPASDKEPRFKKHLDQFISKFGALPVGNEILIHKKNCEVQ